jgi:ABC-type branched-subunit amino acid transport system substrate-binding protein
VVADLGDGSSSRPYLDGMHLAADQVNAAGGVNGRSLVLLPRDAGGHVRQATSLIDAELDATPAAILYVGPGSALTPLRARFEQTGTPVMLLAGDLYTSHGLFRQVFQTTVPWVWQAHVIGRYLVRDRKAKRIAFAGFGPEAPAAAAATRAALAYWGGTLRTSAAEPAGSPPGPAVKTVQGADAVVLFGSPEDSVAMVAALRQLPHPPRIAGSAALLDVSGSALSPPPGTTACYTYTWSGWAEPIVRVGKFRSDFGLDAGHPPVGLEQEGYDAVRTLAVALGRTGGAGGSALVTALESIHRTFSSFPVDLGPDDHTFLPRDELGLFAVPGPNERRDPWQPVGSEQWRALMRTFTYDGLRTNVSDEDKRVFFPFWRRNQPGPEYWRSRYGIVTRPSNDVVH